MSWHQSARNARFSRVRRAAFGVWLLIPLLIGVRLPAAGAAHPIPELAQWEANMLTYGQRLCDYLAASHTFDDLLIATYYDAERVFYQISDYTNNAPWANHCAQRAEAVYRDQYVLPNRGRVPGYWNFTTGLRMDFERTGDAQSKSAVVMLARTMWGSDSTTGVWINNSNYSREVAYAIVGQINAEAVGEPKRARRQVLVDAAYRHMDQWFVHFDWQKGTVIDGEVVQRLAPFMVGLTAHALIRDWEETRDARLLPALRQAADWLWANAWIPDAESMWYDSLDTSGAAPDLNLLIAPIYAFLYRQTAAIQYHDRGEAIFAGGARHAWLGGTGVSGKHFNQNYTWSFDYVRWRKAAPPAAELVAIWRLDEGSGTLATDCSGNGNTGTLTNGPVWTAGRTGQALAFDGLDDHARAASTRGLNLSSAITLAAWVKPDALSNFYSNVVVKGVSGQRGYGLNFQWDKLNFVKVGVEDVTSTIAFTLGSWQHAAVTWEAATGEVKFYRNGVLAETLRRPQAVNAPMDQDALTIGSWPDPGTTLFQGVIDQVRIYSGALSATEVQELYNSGQ